MLPVRYYVCEIPVALRWVETMADTAKNSVIVNRWTLLAFAESHGKMQTGTAKDKDGVEFASCSFTNPTTGARTYVGFSTNLGVLSAKEIAANKHDLQVVQLETGGYRLCRQGVSTWEDVDL